MTAHVVLTVLHPGEVADQLLEATRRHMNWDAPLEVGEGNAVDFFFAGEDWDSGAARVKEGLDAAAGELDVEWSGYLMLQHPP